MTSVHVVRPPRPRRFGRRDHRRAAEPAWRDELRALAPAASESALDAAAAHVDVLVIPAGRAIIRAGDAAHQVVVIQSGRALETSPDGGRRELRPGSVVGAAELRSGDRAGATVRALTPVEAVVVFGPAYLALAGSRSAAT